MENDPYAQALGMLGLITPLPEPFQLRMRQQLRPEHYPAKQILLSPGQTCRRIYYINSGFLRSYYLDRDGKEHTSWFMGKGEVMISVYSFFTQLPAHEYIEVLQDCELLSLSWHQMQSYYADFPQGNLIGRVITEKYYIQSEQRAISLRNNSPEQRYQALLNKHPDIDQLTTTANIASYLCITRETLSRLRSRMLRQHRHMK